MQPCGQVIGALRLHAGVGVLLAQLLDVLAGERLGVILRGVGSSDVLGGVAFGLVPP